MNPSGQTVTLQQAIELALSQHQSGNLAQAETIYRQILNKFPDHAVALHYMGVLAHQLGRNEEALPLLLRSIELFPDQAGYYNNLGETYRALKRFDEAASAFKKAIELNPKDTQAMSNLGLTYGDQNRLAESREMQEAAVRNNPNDANSLCNLGAALVQLGLVDEALPHLKRSAQINPNLAAVQINLAAALTGLGLKDEAIQVCEKAVQIAPSDAHAHLARANALLKFEYLAEGWPEYEWRLKLYPFLVRQFTKPQWRGENLNGRTILLHAEQGFGDAIQFVRYAALVAQRGGKVVLECLPELTDLLSTAPGVTAAFPIGQPPPDFDVCCSLLRLPGIFQTSINTIPNDIPYLRANPTRVDSWKNRLDEIPSRMRIGLCWAGSPIHERDHIRSCKLADLAPLADIRDAVFYSLQKGPASDQASNPPAGMKLIDCSDDIRDFSDAAAIVQNLDLVITVDTAAAHLAGALGKPVWTMLPVLSEWRWLHGRKDSPWYPTMHLVRQPRAGDWKSVAEQIAAGLRAGLPSDSSADIT